MKTVAVLMGGPSSEHEVSLQTGMNVAHALRTKYRVVSVHVTRTGNWLVGPEATHKTPIDALAGVDVVFNAMHGEYGEDGKVQAMLAHANITHTGPSTINAALAMHKARAAAELTSAGLSVPRAYTFEKDMYNEQMMIDMARRFSAPPWVVKPMSRGSSLGTHVVATAPELDGAFKDAFKYDNEVLLQEHIRGRELTCAVLENYNGQEHFALPPIEIVPPTQSKFFDYKVKYNGETKEICPTEFHGAMLAAIRDTAIRAHVALGCRQYSRTDMILKGTKLHVLETNTLPGLTSESLLPKAALVAGITFDKLVEHLVETA